jgi:hypothetical protein
MENTNTNTKQGDPIWVEDYNQIIRRDRVFDFIPNVDMPFSERINAIVRASIYIGIIMMLVHNNYLYIYLPIIVLVSTYLVYMYQSKEIKENYRNLPRQLDPVTENPLLDRYLESRKEKVKCVPTTVDNPFMNALPADDRRRGPACSTINNVELANKVEANFSNNLYKDVNDVFNRNHSERQYYTMPSTTYPNNQGAYVNWLYGGPPTCKESTDKCISNLHTRLNQQSYRNY